MTTIRQEILRRIQSNHQYYAHFVNFEMMNNISIDTTEEILEMFTKLIDSQIEKYDKSDGHESYYLLALEFIAFLTFLLLYLPFWIEEKLN